MKRVSMIFSYDFIEMWKEVAVDRAVYETRLIPLSI
jgi:CRISPR/Cas system-associated endonuclease Cas1